MSDDDIETFRTGLKAAGEPWRSRGLKVVAAGFVALVGAQILASGALLLLCAAILLIGAGWTMLIVAFMRRRRWAKAQVLAPPADDPPSLLDLS